MPVRCSDAGDWLFCGRRWIDPADPDGRTKLDIHYHNLCALYPSFAAACSHDRFLSAVAAVVEGSPHAAHDEAGTPPAQHASHLPLADASDIFWLADILGSDLARPFTATTADTAMPPPLQSAGTEAALRQDIQVDANIRVAAAATPEDDDVAGMLLGADFAALWPPGPTGAAALDPWSAVSAATAEEAARTPPAGGSSGPPRAARHDAAR
jgi:hypothetical protein